MEGGPRNLNDKLQMTIKKTNAVKFGAIYLGIFLVMLVIGSVVGRAFDRNSSVIILDPSGRPISPTPTPTPKTKYSIILLGGGGANHQGGELSDTMLVAEVDTVRKQLTLVNLPRDIWVPITNKETELVEEKKLNFAFYAGGTEEIKKWAKEISGIEIDNYVWVDFDGFVKLVDLLGGLEVDVPMTFSDDLYPIAGLEDETCGKTEAEIKQITATLSGLLVDRQFACRYEKIEFVKGKMQMDGVTALKFVRSRHAQVGGGDFARSQRQQAVVEAVRNKLIQPGNWLKIPSLVSTGKKYYRTDARIDELVQMGLKTPDPRGYTIRRVTLSTDNVLVEGYSADRQYILLPKAGKDMWNSVREFVISEMEK